MQFKNCDAINFLLKFYTMADIVCATCLKTEVDENKLIICSHCHNWYHLKCKGFVGNSGTIARKQPYYCSESCTNIHKGLLEIQLLEGDVFRKSDKNEILEAIQSSQEFLATKFDNFQTRIEQLKKENTALQKEMGEVKQIVYRLEAELDKRDRQQIQKNAMIFGVPFFESENLESIFGKIAEITQASVTVSDISSIHRLYKYNNNINKNSKKSTPPPIKIIFKEEQCRNTFIETKMKHGVILSTAIDNKFINNGKPINVSIREEITPFAINLLNQMKDVQDKLKIKYIWPGRDGTILLRKSDGSKIQKIRSRFDIRRVMEYLQNFSEDEPMEIQDVFNPDVSISPTPDLQPRKLRRKNSRK